jgi:hypothetical protein
MLATRSMVAGNTRSSGLSRCGAATVTIKHATASVFLLAPAARRWWFGHRHFPRVYHAGWLTALPLPTGSDRPPGQPVALLGSSDGDEFDRHLDSSALGYAYADRPRTQVYENTNRNAEGARYSLAARHLGCLARREPQVVCPVFGSRLGDGILGGHWDAWYGAIGQIDGVKVWEIWESLLDGTSHPTHEVTTHAGDVLLLPKGLPHAVRTPRDPGHSVHRAFAIDPDPDPRAGTIAAHMRAAMR